MNYFVDTLRSKADNQLKVFIYCFTINWSFMDGRIPKWMSLLACKSFEPSDVAPELRTRISFSDIQPPLEPNGAAMPVLNGRVFGADAIVAEGDEGSKSD